ncbi:DUF6007 family protein [Staphylococcus pseudoxylosus]|uniref:DUF6007 family protein n=1 Tax=Staphylococcus pseudoxylosus TaxID=2282419 RepID=UPI00398BB286
MVRFGFPNPSFFLYIYLPTYNFISILLNVLIIILVSIGLSSLSFSKKPYKK